MFERPCSGSLVKSWEVENQVLENLLVGRTSIGKILESLKILWCWKGLPAGKIRNWKAQIVEKIRGDGNI